MKRYRDILLVLLLTAAAAAAPQNVVIMICDGCGYSQVGAASLYEKGKTGSAVYETFPVKLAVTTFARGGSYDPEKAWNDPNYIRHGATDSAAAATAMATGQKTDNGRIGVDAQNTPLLNLVERFEALGKSTGVVTSVQFSHATPAGFAAHNPDRGDYAQIAREMILESALDVIMGCGHPWYDKQGRLVSEKADFRYVGGEPAWRQLIAGVAGCDADGDGKDDPWTFIENRLDFQKMTSVPTPKRVLGVAKIRTTLQQHRPGDTAAAPFDVPFIETVPTLEEMTLAALNVLDEDADGFFLMVEGGAVDWACHKKQPGRMIEEMAGFNRAAGAVVKYVGRQAGGWDDTLVVVTSDHETGYLCGPPTVPCVGHPMREAVENKGPGKMPGMEFKSGSHTNSLVPLYARGSGAGQFLKAVRGTDPVRGPYIDNTDIAEVIMRLLRKEEVGDRR
jgi:alkaline phosphatase